MIQINLNDVTQYVEENIGVFHQKRISGLNDLRLKKVLSKKNPYLFKAKYILTAQDIIKSLTDAFISSQEETIFGDWLEGLAIFINQKVYSGRKSGIPGIDVEFDNDGIRYIVTIKSGPNWGNSAQVAKMRSDFKTAQKTLRTSNSKLNITAVNGCCYGRDNNPDKGDYFKYCGQRFWEFISGDTELFTKIIEPLGHKAKERNDDFTQTYAQMINKFTKEFADTFCLNNGSINWDKLVRFNSAKESPKK
ncbi:MAG TPA: PmeII family type II restriction endonuclease [Ferruginibacter sp.]|nr:PmeII family type II restriction endonuclease [Ferruginibacter sp.]HMP21179.1 PmeII family type II restriction endonuclease [Ferruginibacter sp.]